MRRSYGPDGRSLLIEHGRSNWEWLGRNQENPIHEEIELVKAAGLHMIKAERMPSGTFHTVSLSPAKYFRSDFMIAKKHDIHPLLAGGCIDFEIFSYSRCIMGTKIKERS